MLLLERKKAADNPSTAFLCCFTPQRMLFYTATDDELSFKTSSVRASSILDWTLIYI